MILDVVNFTLSPWLGIWGIPMEFSGKETVRYMYIRKVSAVLFHVHVHICICGYDVH